jgi:hypothetical protein
MSNPVEEFEKNKPLQREAMLETYKLEFDIHKTQATLVMGSLIAVIALSDLLVPDEPKFLWLLAVSCVLLLFSMGWSLAHMLRLTTEVLHELSPYSSGEESAKGGRGRKVKRSRWLSLVSFPLGLGIFALFVYWNAFV